MKQQIPPQRIAVVWSPEARASLRAIDRETPYTFYRYLTNRSGDVRKLNPPLTGFRLRCSDYRVFFDHKNEITIEITGVFHRREAYR